MTEMNKRPYSLTEEAAREVAETMLDDVMDWLNDNFDSEEVKENLTDTFLDCTDWNGYSLTKHLEDNHYFSGDRELVDIMDQADTLLHAKLSELQRKWVEENGIKPKFKVGDEVLVKGEKGTIKHVDPVYAKYGVFIPGKCVESGVGTHAYIYTFEQVEAWNAKPDSVSTATSA